MWKETTLNSTYSNKPVSFWQSPIWHSLLTQTKQAKTFTLEYHHKTWLFERRYILWYFTGVYALGTHSVTDANELRLLLSTSLLPTDVFIQIEPLQENGNRLWESTSWNTAPFRRFLEPMTAILPLWELTESQLLNSFSEKGRYNIRLAERRGLVTHWVQWNDICHFHLPQQQKENNKTYVEIFYDLLRVTTERDKFSHNTLEYYRIFLQLLESQWAGGLLITTKDTTLHAAGIFVYWQEQAIYYYGASSNYQEIRRDHGTYLLQWKAIQEAIRRGCTLYDFLGISSNNSDKLAGVTAFKMRFNPQKISLPHETVIILRPHILFVLRAIRTFRAAVISLKSK